MLDKLTFKSLVTANYLDTLNEMKDHLISDHFQNEIWMLEHPPIFTLGTAADKQHILNAKDIPVVQSDRGGEVTYHGPGQLVIYFILFLPLSSSYIHFAQADKVDTSVSLSLAYVSLCSILETLPSNVPTGVLKRQHGNILSLFLRLVCFQNAAHFFI